jgi:hypothetical protein
MALLRLRRGIQLPADKLRHGSRAAADAAAEPDRGGVGDGFAVELDEVAADAAQDRVSPGDVVGIKARRQADAGVNVARCRKGEPVGDARHSDEASRGDALVVRAHEVGRLVIEGHDTAGPQIAQVRRAEGPEVRAAGLGGEREGRCRANRGQHLPVPHGREVLGPGEEVSPVIGRGGRIDDAEDGDAIADQRHRDRRAAQPHQEGAGAVLRVDDPGVGRVRGDAGRFLVMPAAGMQTEKAVLQEARDLGVDERGATAAARTARAVELGAQERAHLEDGIGHRGEKLGGNGEVLGSA